MEKHVRKQLQIEHAAKSSHKAKLVKLADKLDNLRDLEKILPNGWTEVSKLTSACNIHIHNTLIVF